MHTPPSFRLWLIAVSFICLTATLGSAQCPDGGLGQWSVGLGQRYAGPYLGAQAMIVADPDGAGPLPVMLIVGGYFDVAGAISAKGIAAWNGTDWITLGTGFNADVRSLAMYNGELYAAGSFTYSGQTACNHIARWDAATATWRPLGAGLDTLPINNNATVNAMTVFNGRLYVAGNFRNAGGSPARCIASWDGSSWQPLGTAVSGGGIARTPGAPFPLEAVNAMAVFNGLLYVGGLFDHVNGAAINTFATWNGTAWAAGPTVANTNANQYPQIRTLASAASGLTVAAWLYAGGDFTSINGVAASNIATISRATSGVVGSWSPMAGGLGGPVDKLYIDMGTNSPSAILANGTRPFTNSINPNEGLNRFASGAWSSYAPEQARVLGKYNGQYVASIVGVGGDEFFLARRVGTAWLPFGNGLSYPPASVFPGPGGTDLYAIGNMSIADQQPVGGIARLDASGAWNPVGTSPFIHVKSAVANATDLFAIGETSLDVYALRRFTAGAWTTVSGGELGGQKALRTIGSDVYLLGANLHKWNGTAFVQVGPALPSTVYEVVVINGVLHALLASGMYDLEAGAWTLERAYRGGGTASEIHSATVYNNRLFISFFANMGGVDELVGNAWVNRGQFYIYSFTELNGQLYALNYAILYKLDGTNLVPVADPITGWNLAVHHGDLIIGGGTVFEGQTITPVFARLVCCAADTDGSGVITVADIFAFLSSWFASSPAADFNGSGQTNVQDIFDFLAAWFVGC